ncbi:helix-turn-helix domain-containing protein [Labedaea rhizosphaerae]|uniref:helix-turn-helix domain-containing protein n=1 Tax=Labedaea rhizosphaerae TaxID=598644 RepID=UPI002442DE47|nr:excisionase family DNA-binding protein [Labedaea rhizosphaerae]
MAEAAEKLRVSKMTIYRMISEGEFPAIRLRGRYSVPRGPIDAIIRQAIVTNSTVDVSEWTKGRR